MPIKILADEVASQIAAGEVVENPASVVKELVENAIDAGATKIDINIEDAGKKLIEVSDNGTGIPLDEIHLAVMRHATSKINSSSELTAIKTLGFRGEALASIASVSHFTLISSGKEKGEGGELHVNGGIPAEVKKTGAPEGTMIRVQDLFFNVPARLKFLKTDQTERRRIQGFVSRYAAAYADISFSLIIDNKLVFSSSGNGNRREVLSELFDADLARSMVEVDFEDIDIRIDGFISPISITKSHRREITFFVNGRWVQDSALISALLKAYHTYLMVGRYPVCVLFIQIIPELVDVNVHPAKAEVRFANPGNVFSCVQRAIRRALLSHSPVAEIRTKPSVWQSSQTNNGRIDPAWQMSMEIKKDSGITAESANTNESVEAPLSSGISAGLEIPLLRVIGQVGGTYIIAEGPDGIYLIDQHAAHERILYEKMVSKLDENVPSQKMLEPIRFELNAVQSNILEENLQILNQIGFDIDLFGKNEFIVRAVPVILMHSDPISAVKSVVEEFEEDETPLKAEKEKRLVARICKRSAIKGGQILSSDEQHQLIRDLEGCISPRTCPHGRPTMIHLSVDMLENQFGRKGSR